jgi:hypothetical protein
MLSGVRIVETPIRVKGSEAKSYEVRALAFSRISDDGESVTIEVPVASLPERLRVMWAMATEAVEQELFSKFMGEVETDDEG